MRFINFLAVTAVLSLVLAAQGHAQDLMVYPAQGQKPGAAAKGRVRVLQLVKAAKRI